MSPHLQEPILVCKQVWPYWEHSRYLAHSALFIGVIKPSSKLLGTCIVRIQCVYLYFLSQKVFQSLERNDYQFPQFKSTYRIHKIPCEEQKNSFFLECNRVIYICEEMKNQFKLLLEICIVQHVPTENVYLHFCRNLSDNHNQAYTSLCPKGQKKFTFLA